MRPARVEVVKNISVVAEKIKQRSRYSMHVPNQ